MHDRPSPAGLALENQRHPCFWHVDGVAVGHRAFSGKRHGCPPDVAIHRHPQVITGYQLPAGRDGHESGVLARGPVPAFHTPVQFPEVIGTKSMVLDIQIGDTIDGKRLFRIGTSTGHPRQGPLGQSLMVVRLIGRRLMRLHVLRLLDLPVCPQSDAHAQSASDCRADASKRGLRTGGFERGFRP